MSPEKKFNSRPRRRQMAEICFQKAPGQDLAKNGCFPMIPEEKFNSRPRGRQMAESCFQKAPGQDLAKSGQWHWRPSCFKLKWEGAGLKFRVKIIVLESVPLQIEMRSRRVKIRVKIIVLETVPFQIEMKGRRVKIRVKIIVLETVPFQIEMKGRKVRIRVEIIVLETVAKWQKCASKRLPARIWLKTAVSYWAQKRNSIAGRSAAKWQKFASKRLQARIWPKTAVSQWSQKRNSIAGRGAAKSQKVASKRLPARIWPKTANGGISTRIRMRVNIILLHGGNPGPRKEKDKTTRKRNPRKCLDFFHGWLDMIVLETVLIFSGEKTCWRS